MQVGVGTPVRVINQPVKYSVEPNGKRYIEVHRPLSQDEGQNTQTMSYSLPVGFAQFTHDKASDKAQIDRAMYRRAGYPVVVSSGATPAASGNASVLSVQNGAAVTAAEKVTQ